VPASTKIEKRGETVAKYIKIPHIAPKIALLEDFRTIVALRPHKVYLFFMW
jgi:hypothetical protein